MLRKENDENREKIHKEQQKLRKTKGTRSITKKERKTKTDGKIENQNKKTG